MRINFCSQQPSESECSHCPLVALIWIWLWASPREALSTRAGRGHRLGGVGGVQRGGLAGTRVARGNGGAERADGVEEVKWNRKSS